MQKIITLCDMCAEGSEKAAQPVIVALGIKGRREVVDLCTDHYDVVMGPVVALFTEHGRNLPEDIPEKAEKKSTSGKNSATPLDDGTWLACIFCGNRSANSDAMTKHLRNVHEFANMEAAYGSFDCPLCQSQFANSTGLGAHAKSHETYRGGGIHGLYLCSLEQGDPHKIIAKRRADLGISGPVPTL